ncbi:RHS repeat domain-containing protein [Puia dinghuensis]|uniref:YD repeat-containing protein n=1 Tax=Puia dinghuensis TaxID=1792502 RepID=A0A8J2XTL4_9BACT|nr:RHS repeat domain-containing protein [Puia dinghuensis]GGB18305.1 hypothetical protein GCM10011511_47660 [Puia dinghuensis]
MKYLLPVISLFCFPFCVLHAQDDLKKYVNTMPPNVASFEKYGDVPLSYNTGQVAETIPLYTFPIDNVVSIPIDLSYNNNGMKPDAVPSWVGHGWDLMPGGYIVQDIRGLDDLGINGMADPNAKAAAVSFMTGAMPVANRYQYIHDALGGLNDSQQDIFSLNILGKSAKFYFDGSQIKFLKWMPYSVVLDNNRNFIVTDEKGYQYTFGLRTFSSGSINNDPFNQVVEGGSNTWWLTKIVTPYGTEADLTWQQDAQYQTITTNNSYSVGATGIQQSGCIFGATGPNQVQSISLINQEVLQSISYQGRKVLFNTIARNDLTTINSTVAHALSSIQVLNDNSQLVKNINFSYDNNARLKLLGLSVLDNGTNAPVQNYTFSYYQYNSNDLTSIPLITSANRTYAIDHWGYYNGITGNTFSGVPKANYALAIPNNNYNVNWSIPGDNDRTAYWDAARMGMLQKITYPTGGYTTFDYEGNQIIYPFVQGIPAFLNYNLNYSNNLVNVPGASDATSCPSAEGESGMKTGTFTISTAMNVQVDWQFVSVVDNSAYCELLISSTSGGNPYVKEFAYTSTGSVTITLPADTYTYTIDPGCAFAQQGVDNPSVSFQVYQILPAGNIPVSIGGDRVLRVTSYDPVANQTTVKKLSYADEEFYQIPNYVSQVEMITTASAGLLNLPANADCGPQYFIGAQSVVPFDGSTIYYRTVTENLGENGENGKTVYSYPYQLWYASSYTQSPYPPIMNLSWRATEQQKDDYVNQGNGNFSVLHSTAYKYTDPPVWNTPQIVQGVKFGNAGDIMAGQPDPNDYGQYYNSGQVYYPADRFDRSQLTETQNTSSGGPITKVTNYSYNANYFLPSQVTTTNSKGQTVEQDIWYPGDYNSNVANMATLVTNHMVGLPVKTTTSRNGNITDGTVSDFDNSGNVTGIHRYESSTLQALPAHDPATLYPPSFNLKLSLNYTSNAKAQEYLPANDIPTAILWGYNGSYPLAEVKKAHYQDLVNVLGQTVINQLSGSAPGTDDQVRAALNQLRTDPRLKGALVTSYTYQPFIGMTSQTDPAGRTTYYEYDGLGRLKLVRDQNANIVKAYDYHYQGQ